MEWTDSLYNSSNTTLVTLCGAFFMVPATHARARARGYSDWVAGNVLSVTVIISWRGVEPAGSVPTSHHDFIDGQLKVTKNFYLGWARRYRQPQAVWLLTCRQLQNSVRNASSNTKWESTNSDGQWLMHVSLQANVDDYTAPPAGGHYYCWWTDSCH
jgi:hypothetical protein